jgi:4-diphosphocytidyl-2-C-methyl-D-erythritol kinase
VEKFKIKSYCKVNLSLKIIKKLSNGYHNIISLITFCKLNDLIFISKVQSPKDNIIFSGKFKKGINKKSNTVTKVLSLFRKNKLLGNQKFKIKIQKNIPHGSGLGGGSANAADLINYLNLEMKLKLSKKNLINLGKQIGFDVPLGLERKNILLTGKKNEILKIKQKFKLDLLVVYPSLICSTKKIYKANKNISQAKPKTFFYKKNKKQLINFLKNENNDLEDTVIKIYPKVKKIINYIKLQKGCYFSRITGSGSACIGIFSSRKNALYTQKLIKLKYPKYWCAVSKTM